MLVQYFQLKKISLAMYPQIQQVKAAKKLFTGTAEFFIFTYLPLHKDRGSRVGSH